MGYSVATTILSAAASDALTDLATVKSELGLGAAITGHDVWLTRAIAQVSRAIATHTRRRFVPELVRDVFDVERDAYPAQTPGGFSQLVLSRWPVIAIASVTQDPDGAAAVLGEGEIWRLDGDAAQLLRLNPYSRTGSSWDAMPVAVDYVAGYGRALVRTDSVPGAAPYTIAVEDWSCDIAVTAGGAALTRVAGPPAEGQYSAAAGMYLFNAADAGRDVSLSYAAADIPEDLQEACLRLVTARFKAKDRDPALIQRDTPGVGTERWWFGGAPGQKGPFPPDIAAMLEPYRGAVVA